MHVPIPLGKDKEGKKPKEGEKPGEAGEGRAAVPPQPPSPAKGSPAKGGKKWGRGAWGWNWPCILPQNMFPLSNLSFL